MTVAAAPIYEAYAPIYDAIGQGRFSARMAAWALAWLPERLFYQQNMRSVTTGRSRSVIAMDRVTVFMIPLANFP